MTIVHPAFDDTSYTRLNAAMDHNWSQQLSTSKDKGYQTFASVTCTATDDFLAAQDFTRQPVSSYGGNFRGMCLEMSQKIYDSSGPFDTVETSSTAINLEQSLPSTQHQQKYLDRTICSSVESCDLMPTTGCLLDSSTFISLTPTTVNDLAYDVSFGSTTCLHKEAAKCRTDRCRKDRRRAQNRAAQRAYRSRQEETIKENMVKVKSLEENLTCIQSANTGLCEAVANLTAKVLRLQGENAMLEQSRPCYGLR